MANIDPRIDPNTGLEIPSWMSPTGLSYKSSDNPMYDAYYKANPFVGQMYKKTFWDDLFDGVFRTGYDKWRDEMALNASQWDAGVVDLQQSNEYNSEVQKASRMREAGENPDLLGTGDVSDSSGMKPDVQDAQIPDALDFGQVASFAGMICQCFQGALGMASAGIDLIGKISNIDAQNISNASSMQDLALQYIRNSIPAVGLENDADYVSWKEKLGALSTPNVAWNESLARSLGLKKGQRKAFDLALNNAIGSLPAEYERFKLLDDYADKKLSSARKTSSSFYDDSFEVMKGLSQVLVEDNDKFQSISASVAVKQKQAEEVQADVDIAQAEVDLQYLDEAGKRGLGRQKAVADVEDVNLRKIQQSIDRQIKNTKKKILNMLEGMADNGNTFANYMIYNMMLHDYMNFEFKASLDAGIGKHLPKAVQGWLPSFGTEMELGLSAK